MKTITLSIIFLLFANISFSQDSSKITAIDVLVNNINQSKYQLERDTIIQDKPEYGLKMETYLTMLLDGKQLKKYENYVLATMTSNGASKEIITSSTFYYDQDKLIKVEEYMTEGNSKKVADWYFSEDKLLYSIESEKDNGRAALLLTISDGLLKLVNK